MLRLQHAKGPEQQPSVNAGCVVSTTGLTCLRTGAHISYVSIYIELLVYKRRLASQTAEWQPFTIHVSTATFIYAHRQTDDPPSPPTHSADSIQETTNTPTGLLPHRGLVCLISARVCKEAVWS